MIDAVLVDDEKDSTETLDILLKNNFPDIRVVGKFNDSLSAIEFLQKNHFDLLFLDIEMPGMNGFDLLQEIQKDDFEVVFVTAYDQFALKAFRYSAFDYLLKPVEIEDLASCIAKYQEEKLQLKSRLEYLQRMIKHTGTSIEKIAVPTSQGFEFIEIKDIIRCESDGNYTRIFLSNQPVILVSRTLKDFEELLEEMNFVRVHQSHLINLKYLRKYIKSEGGYIEMQDGTQITVSRSRKDELINKLNFLTFS
ncbi:LytR/AlgR family response regulator transcription factor [Emticicia agri]|uniref:Response regulator transcription factor n=1 Tax=Emticicia agri TaxID=2492393 RepID=A0A4Q5LYM6_9BACT|nr:LytTR family DNA-binding domain-containing protein [Emticicia agri]RYU95026.1 response regulator transcription factor [Emticicia agri]